MTNSIHRYKVITGKFAGQTIEAYGIGYMAYPDQIKNENMNHEAVMNLYKVNREGVWYEAAAEKIEFERRIDSTSVGTVVDYGNIQDLVITFDKYNNEIFVGDELYAAVKNAVRRVKVTKIAPKATFASGGVLIRKITVVDLDSGQTLTINQSRDTVKIITGA